jgi:hypothetical protein
LKNDELHFNLKIFFCNNEEETIEEVELNYNTNWDDVEIPEGVCRLHCHISDSSDCYMDYFENTSNVFESSESEPESM